MHPQDRNKNKDGHRDRNKDRNNNITAKPYHLSEYDQNSILKDFPNIELSYETIIHKTVYNDKIKGSQMILAIPEGSKYFAWFTTFKAQNVCVLLEISKNKQICSVEITKVCFNNQLSYGTILYGTIFRQSIDKDIGNRAQTKYFSSEDIFYYKGKNVSNYPFIEKLNLFKTIYSSEIKQISYNSSIMVFGLPILSLNYNDLINTVKTLSYTIQTIQFRNIININDPILIMKYDKELFKQNLRAQILPCSLPLPILINTRKETIFRVKADIQNDIYNLYVIPQEKDKKDKKGEEKEEKDTIEIYDVAYIPDYKTSVMMNGLFRNIKENINLDALEESDDEDEFENDKVDKFVDLNKMYDMVCIYNFKYKKWTPIRLSAFA